jgi:outer membrane protein TolC
VHLQRTVLPLRAKLVAESQRFVNAMEHSVFTLLLARQAEIDAGQAYVEALRDYWSLRARLEQDVGGSFQPLRPDEQATGGAQRPMQSPRTP